MLTVMVIDDEPIVRGVVAEILRRDGFEVLGAAGVQDACRLAQAHAGPIDLLIVNRAVNDGDGMRAVETMRRGYPNAKVLRYSGFPAEHLIRRGELSPGAAFVQKPFRADQLRAKVQEVLQSEQVGNRAQPH